MLKNYYNIDTKNFKCNENKYKNWVFRYMCFSVYYSLNDFINEYKQYFIDDSRKSDFDYYFRDLITFCLYDLKIQKNDKITLFVYDDYIVLYTNNKKYEYIMGSDS